MTGHEHSRRRIRRRSWIQVLLRAFAVAGLLASAHPVVAQEQKHELDEVVVTGSRLVRSDLSAPSPTTVINEEAVRLSGDATVEKVLNELPQLSAGNNSSVNSAGGSGVLTANLRGLGNTRTLTLVNGRRFIPANGAGSVDLTTIPNALVQRVDVITGGASAVYGSDAIAGAVNFILRKDFEGFDFSTQFAQTSASDGKQVNFDAMFGTNIGEDRGNITLFASRSTRDPVMMQDRDFSAVPLNANLGPSGSGNIPGGRVGLSAAQLATLNLGSGPGVIPTGPDGCTTPVNSIRFDANGRVMRHCDPETLYNYAAGNYLLRPLERWQLSGLAHYQITDSIETYLEAHYALAQNEFQQASDSLSIVTGTNSYFEVLNYATNPVLSADVRTLFVNNPQIFDPMGTGNARIPGGIARRVNELGLRNFAFERDTIGSTVGLRGDFGVGEHTWQWDVFGQYHRSGTDETVRGTMSPARMSLGLNSTTNAAGQVVCVTPVFGCVPVNPFGLDSISPAAAAFISPARSSSDLFERTVAGASLAGEFLELPAGPVSAAIGIEYRSDDYEFMPGATDLALEYGSASRGITAGRYDVSEVFGEVRVPLLSEKPFADVLAIEGAIRYSDYSNFGGANTWRAGLEWGPVDWLRFRSAYNVAIRAPAISELYAPVTEGFSPGNDPCAAIRNPSQAQRDFCVQQGVPAAEANSFVQAALGFSQLSGGNPDLREENSETLTFGAVIRLPWVERFNIAVDYYDIQVDDAVATMNAQTTLDVCYQLLDANSEPCRAITRLPNNGQIYQVRASNSNIGSLAVEGIDLTLDYTFGLGGGIGDGGSEIGLMLQSGWLFERESQIVGAQPIDCAGFFGSCTAQGAGGSPDFKALFAGTWNTGPLMLRTQLRFFDGLKPLPAIAASTPVVAGSVLYVDLVGQYNFNDTVELYAGVDNAFDEDPPLLTSSWGGDANTDVTLYDVIGRRYFMGLRVHF
jgi:iron complex outermembrane recepter protein